MQKILHSKILGEGKPLLILHGFLGSGDNWITLGRKFSAFYEVHLIDLRNHGRSFHDPIMNYEVMTNDIIRYCTYYKLENIRIIGHSMGGKVAMFLAMAQPNLLAKLCIADIAPKVYVRGHDYILEALQKVDFTQYKTRESVGILLRKYIDNTAIVAFLLKNVYHKSNDSLGFRFNLSVFVSQYEKIMQTLPEESCYKGATLFLKGSLSSYILQEDFAVIKKHFPKATIQTIARAGHWLHAENPIEFYDTCIKFFAKS